MTETTTFGCKRCVADPQPEWFEDPRKCAFLADGSFTPENWNCATLGVILDAGPDEIEGVDESMQVIAVPDEWASTSGFIVLNRYKHRGCTSSAMHVGDFWPARPLTLELAERVADDAEARQQKPSQR